MLAVIGLPDPENRRFGEPLGAVLEFPLEKEVDRERRAERIRKFKRDAVPVRADEFMRFSRRDRLVERMDRGVEVALKVRGMDMLEPRASRGIGAVDSKALSLAREPGAQVRHRVEPVHEGVGLHDGVDAEAFKEVHPALFVLVAEAVGDDAVALRADP